LKDTPIKKSVSNVKIGMRRGNGNRRHAVGRMLICPGWSIAGKFMLPGHSADSDSILEPNEQFELLICPSDTTVPYQESTVIIDPARGALPLPVSRSASPLVLPVMQHG